MGNSGPHIQSLQKVHDCASQKLPVPPVTSLKEIAYYVIIMMKLESTYKSLSKTLDVLRYQVYSRTLPCAIVVSGLCVTDIATASHMQHQPANVLSACSICYWNPTVLHTTNVCLNLGIAHGSPGPETLRHYEYPLSHCQAWLLSLSQDVGISS